MKNVRMASFLAVGDDGKTYRVNAFQLVGEAGVDAFDADPPSQDPKHWQYFTDRGNGYVQRLGKGRYKMLDEDFTLTPTDSAAAP